MKLALRIIKLIIEIAVAVTIFFIIIQKTPLFDRAIPERTPSTTPQHTGQDSSTTSPLSIPPISSSSTYKIVMMPGIGPVVTTERINSSSLSTSPVYETPLRQLKSCRTPQGQNISHGQSITMYRTSQANNSNECYAQIRTCQDGKLLGNYTHPSCTYTQDGIMRTTDGKRLVTIAGADDDSQRLIDTSDYYTRREVYTYERTQSPEQNNQTLTLSQARSQYMQNTTTIQRPERRTRDILDQVTIRDIRPSSSDSCRSPRGTQVEHGSFVYAFSHSTNSINQTCFVQKRACIDGKLSGSYRYPSCQYSSGSINPISIITRPSNIFEGTRFIKAPYVIPFEENIWTVPYQGFYNSSSLGGYKNRSCENPRGGTISHGWIITAYKSLTGSVANPCQRELRTCQDGKLSGSFTYNTCTNIGTYTPSNPTPPTSNHIYRTCTAPRGDVVPHNRAITAYRLPHGTANSACDVQVRRCRDGILGGSFNYASCTDYTPPLRSPRRPWRWFGW